MKDSYVPSSGDLVLGWECVFTNEFVPSLHCVCQPDKNIRCQLAAWRGEDSSANEADPLTVSPLLARSVSLWERHSSYYSLGLGALVQGWLLSTSTTVHTHPSYSVLQLFPVWVCVCGCANGPYALRQCYITMTTLWRGTEIGKRTEGNREEQPRSWQCGDSRKQDWQKWGWMEPWTHETILLEIAQQLLEVH